MIKVTLKDLSDKEKEDVKRVIKEGTSANVRPTQVFIPPNKILKV